MPKKRAGTVFIVLGAVLICSALLLFAYNRWEAKQAGQAAEGLLAGVQDQIGQGKSDSDEMPIVLIDGYEYVGYISIPDLKVTLPVMADWDYTRLKLAPCRQFGSSRTDDLVIAAHNYPQHFGRLKDLSPGAAVTFTDMAGVVNHYAVEEIVTRQPTDVAEVQESGYDLVLYTCTYGGKTRVVTYCNRTEEAE